MPRDNLTSLTDKRVAAAGAAPCVSLTHLTSLTADPHRQRVLIGKGRERALSPLSVKYDTAGKERGPVPKAVTAGLVRQLKRRVANFASPLVQAVGAENRAAMSKPRPRYNAI